MSTTVHIHAVAPATEVPRGARVAAELAVAGVRLFQGILHGLRLARGRADDAAQVRELARQLQNTDPAMAAELYAAAARHEGLDELLEARGRAL